MEGTLYPSLYGLSESRNLCPHKQLLSAPVLLRHQVHETNKADNIIAHSALGRRVSK